MSKRTIDLIPNSNVETEHEIAWCHRLDSLALLASAEINKFTGVLRIFSQKTLVRAAMLFFKGKILGCVYTRYGIQKVLMNENACIAFVEAMIDYETVVDAYALKSTLVLSASGLFQGPARRSRHLMATPTMVLEAIGPSLGKMRTGTIVSYNAGGALCAIYIRLGVIVGVFSYQHGWMSPSIQSVVECLEFSGEVEVSTSTLAVFSEDDFEQFSIRPATLTSKRGIRRKSRYGIRNARLRANRNGFIPPPPSEQDRAEARTH